MSQLLVAAVGQEGITYVHRARQLGMGVRVLDCFENYRQRLLQWHGDTVLHVPGRRQDVRSVVGQEQFDVAIVHEEADFVRTALVTQSLREAGIPMIIVVTNDGNKRTMYRKCGAHKTIVANTVDQAWLAIVRYLPVFATA